MACRALVSGVLSVVSASCWSLSLGQFTGQAVMGQPLALSIPLGLSAGESATDLCPVVRVYFAEEVLLPSQVKTSVRTGDALDRAMLNVSTLAALNEPYARVDVVAGCTNQFSRQFTILADLPSLDTAQTTKAPPSVALPVSQAVPAQTSLGSGQRLGRADDSNAFRAAPPPNKKPVRVAQEPARTAEQANTGAVRAKSESGEVQGARLKLDPVELVTSMAQLAPSLKMASEGLAVADVESNPELEQRRAAARALWRAMNEAPEQVATNSLKVDAVGSESQALKAQLAAARQAEADLQAALATERDGVYTHPLVLALGGGLVLVLGGLAVAVGRRKTPSEDKQAWWKRPIEKSVQPEKATTSTTKVVPRPKANKKLTVLRESLQDWWRKRNRRAETDSLLPLDSMVKATPVLRTNALNRGVEHGHTVMGDGEFSVSVPMDGSRSMATEELFDLQQQVEFFMSLGQAEQAVDVLVNHLSDSQEPSPLAYLDLLRLYHDLDRRTEYEAIRTDFNRLFSGSSPAFDDYSHSRRGLERYEAALSRIQSLWATPAVLGLIERSIFRQSAANEQDVFDLEAYRELLLLYGIAKEILAPDSMMGAVGMPSTFGFFSDDSPVAAHNSTVMQPLAAQTRESRRRDEAAVAHLNAPVAVDTVIEPREPDGTVGAKGLDLDLDLSLDIDLSDGGLNLATVPAPVASRPVANEDPMSFDLSNSMFDALPEPGEPAVSFAVPKGQTQLAQLDDASLDFLGLDDIDSFSIKKSGTKS